MGGNEDRNKPTTDMAALKREFPVGTYTDEFRTYIYHARRYMTGEAGQCQNCKLSVDWDADECPNCHWPFTLVAKKVQKAKFAGKGMH